MHLFLHAQLTPDDYLEAQRLHVGWRAFLRMSLLMFILITAVFMAIVELGQNRFWMGPATWLVWEFFFCFTYPQAMTKRSRKIFAQQKSLQVLREVEISETHFSAKSEWGNVQMPWADFHKWKADSKMVLVYSSDVIFFVFPRRWFASNADYASFQELLAKTIGPMGKARKAAT